MPATTLSTWGHPRWGGGEFPLFGLGTSTSAVRFGGTGEVSRAEPRVSLAEEVIQAMSIATSIVLLAVGAILRFAVEPAGMSPVRVSTGTSSATS